MIIKINQISYASDPEYDIEGFERVYQANAGFYSKYQSVTVRASDCLYEARFDPAGVGDYIPLSYLFGKEKVTRRFCLYKDDCAYSHELFNLVKRWVLRKIHLFYFLSL